MTLNGQALRPLVESNGPDFVAHALVERLWSDDPHERLAFEDFSIREAWEAFVGPVSETLSVQRAQRHGGYIPSQVVEALHSEAFTNLTGNVIAARVQRSYDDVPGILDQLVETVPSSMRTERFAGLQSFNRIKDVPEGQEYPDTGLADKAVEGPEPLKRGQKIELTEETVFFDRTGAIMREAANIGRAMKNDREARGIHAIEDLSAAYYSYYPVVDGVPTRTALYRVVGGIGTEWYNRTANSKAITLEDWSDIDEALQVFAGMTDEDGNPINIVPNQVLVPRALQATILFILGATEVQKRSSGAAFGGSLESAAVMVNPNIMQIISQMGGQLTPLTSPHMSSTTTWYMGDFKAQFFEQEHFPIQTVELPADQRRDIMIGYRVRRKSRVYASDDKYVLKLT